MSQKFPIIATGRRKTAVAQVQLLEGSGQFTINGKVGIAYLQENASSILCVEAPFNLLNLENKYDLIVKVKGGGFLGQAEAIQPEKHHNTLNVKILQFFCILKTF